MTNEVSKPVVVGPVAHGGHCVARLDGRVVFVRHALPGETVRLKVVDNSRESYWFADAVEIVKPSKDRVQPVCPIAGPGGCGGCDWQHASKSAQLELKRSVVAEQMLRLAGVQWDGTVEPVSPDFEWRTRMHFWRAGRGWGMRAYHSHTVLGLPRTGCAISAVAPTHDVLGDEAIVVGASSGTVTLGKGDRAIVTEKVGGYSFEVEATGFWQAHVHAPELLTEVVLGGLAPQHRERAFDLYCGSGLFAAALASAGCIVSGVEGNRVAVEHAKRNVPEATFLAGDVAKRISDLPTECDLVVLDPPRAGAGLQVMNKVCSLGARAIAYVACDPAAMARDINLALKAGYRLSWLRAFDLFPQTHHIECVALLEKS